MRVDIRVDLRLVLAGDEKGGRWRKWLLLFHLNALLARGGDVGWCGSYME